MRFALLIALLLGCAEDESPCQELLQRCELCTEVAQLEVCAARAEDRDQVRCSLALADVRENCGTDGGVDGGTGARDQGIDALPVGR